MAKGKKKKKKSSQTDSENSSAAKESHGTKIHRGQTSDITDCTCLTQPQRRKTFLPCFAKKATAPNCPIHSSNDSTVIKKPKSKEKDTTNQPCIVRRIGRWIVKKVTKGKKEEQIITETLKPESETVYDNISEPPRLQILCQQALSANGPEGSAQATTATDNSVEPGSIDKNGDDNANPETDRNTVISLKELCIRVAHNTDSTSKDINDSNQDIEIDDAQLTDHDLELDNDEYKNISEPLRLQILCQQALSANGPEGSAQATTATDNSVEPGSIDKNGDDNANPETDRNTVISLEELCIRVAHNTDSTSKDINDSNQDIEIDDAQPTDHDLELDNDEYNNISEPLRFQILCQQALSANGPEGSAQASTATDNSVEPGSIDKNGDDNANPETDRNTVISLKELCIRVAHNTDSTSKDINDSNQDIEIDDAQLTDHDLELDNDEYKNISEPLRLQILCQQALSANGPEGSAQATTATDNSVEPGSIDKNGDDNANPETDRNTVISLKELCIRVAHNTDSTSKDINDSNQDIEIDDAQPTDHDLELDNDEYNNISEPLRLQILCQQALSANGPEGSAQASTATDNSVEPGSIDKNGDDNANPETDRNTVISLKELCIRVAHNTDSTSKDINDSNQDIEIDDAQLTDHDLELDNDEYKNISEPLRLHVLCQQALSANGPEGSAQATTATDNSVEPGSIGKNDDDNTNPETDRNTVISLKELCIRVAHNTVSTSKDINDSNQDIEIDDAQPTDHDLELDNDEYNQVTVMSLKDMCKAALLYPDDLEYNIDNFKTDHTDEQDKHDNDPELDSASISSECHGNVLMTLIQLCTRVVVSNANDKKITHIDDINDCNQDIEIDDAQHTDHDLELDNDENNQVTVMSLQDMCKAAPLYSNDLEYNLDDSKTDQTDEQDKNDTNDSEFDSASISSECHGNVLMTLIQLCTRVVVSNADDKKITHIDDKDKANDEFYTRNGNLECDSNKLMSLKDLCTTVVAAANAKTPDVTDSENTDSKTTGITDNKKKLGNDETQSKQPIEKRSELKNKDMNPEYDQMTVMSLKEMCKATVTYLDGLKYKTDATRAEPIDNHDEDDRNDPDLNITSKDLAFNGNVPMTLSQFCTKVVNNTNDKKTTDRDDKDNTNDEEKRTKNVNLECDRKPMTLKDICTMAIISASSVDVINTEKSPKDDAAKRNNTRLLSLMEMCSAAIRHKRRLKSDASGGKTARQMHDKDVYISNDNTETIIENILKYDKNPTKTLKELCSTAIKTADVKTIMKGIEEDYIFVEVANDMEENCETDHESIKTKSTCLRHERLAEGKHHEDNNTKLSKANLTIDKKLEKSKNIEDDKQDIKTQPKLSVQSQVRMCMEEVKNVGKLYENFRKRQSFKAGIKPGDDKSKAKFLKNRHKASTNDAGDQKIGISYTKTDQDIDRPFRLDEDLSEIMMENTRAITMTLKQLRNNEKGSGNEFKSGYGYKVSVYDKTELESLTRNRPINEIKLENDKAIAMTLKELSATTDDNAGNMRARTCDTEQVHVSKTTKLTKLESNNFDLLSGYDPNSPMSLKEIYLKAMRKTYGVKEDINTIEGEEAADKDRGEAEEIRPSWNKFSDMTDYMQKHYLLTSALLALMEMCDKESLQIKDEDIDQYMTKESDTKKECVRELLQLAENLKKLSEATMTNINNNDKKQELANNTIRHYRKEIRKVNGAIDGKQATDRSKNTADVNIKSQFRKTKETHSVNVTSHGQTTSQAAVSDIVVTVQKKENGKLEEASGGLPRIKESQENVCHSKSDTAFVSETDDENVYQNHADGTDIDKIYKATQAHYDDIGVNKINDTVKTEDIDAKHVNSAFTSVNDDGNDYQNHADDTDIDTIYEATQTHHDDIGVNQINDIVKKGDINAKHVNVNSLQDTEKINAGEMTKQKTEIEATDKPREKAAKRVTDRGRDTGQDIVIAKINTTTDSAKAVAGGAEIRQKNSETNRFETKKASEEEGHDQLMIGSYNERNPKKKSRNKARLQFEIDYHTDMDGKIIAAKLPENLHTLTDNEYTLPVVEEKNLKRRKQKKVHSHCAGKTGKDSKRDNGARQSSHNQPEVRTEAKVKPNSRCSRNENMTLAALYCDDVVYISQATKNPTPTQFPSEVTELVQRQRGTEERPAGIEREAHLGSLNDQSKEAELASECHDEKKSGYGKDQRQAVKQASKTLAGQISGIGKGQATGTELSSDSHAEQTLDSTATASGRSTTATSQRWRKKKKQKRKKAKWY